MHLSQPYFQPHLLRKHYIIAATRVYACLKSCGQLFRVTNGIAIGERTSRHVRASERAQKLLQAVGAFNFAPFRATSYADYFEMTSSTMMLLGGRIVGILVHFARSDIASGNSHGDSSIPILSIVVLGVTRDSDSSSSTATMETTRSQRQLH
jgi:hypothetical protein